MIVFGSLSEDQTIEEIIGRYNTQALKATHFDINELMAAISGCDLLITNDTGPMHLAAAQGIKTVGLFGPETPVIFGPFGKNTKSIFKGF